MEESTHSKKSFLFEKVGFRKNSLRVIMKLQKFIIVWNSPLTKKKKKKLKSYFLWTIMSSNKFGIFRLQTENARSKAVWEAVVWMWPSF